MSRTTRARHKRETPGASAPGAIPILEFRNSYPRRRILSTQKRQRPYFSGRHRVGAGIRAILRIPFSPSSQSRIPNVRTSVLNATRRLPRSVIVAGGHHRDGAPGDDGGDDIDHEAGAGSGLRLLDEVKRRRPIDHGANETEQEQHYGMVSPRASETKGNSPNRSSRISVVACAMSWSVGLSGMDGS